MKGVRTAIVTGAARGIGNAIARQLAVEGCAIVIADVFDEEKVSDNMEKVGTAGQAVLYIKADITSDESRRDIVNKTLKAFGRIDILVNNAGVAPKVRMDILQTTEESMDFVLGVNLKGTFFLTQRVANSMVEKINEYENMKPVIVNISSNSAYTSSVQRGEYCISKAGVSMITTLFADRMAEYGINVYEVRPGIILTDMTAVVKEKYDRMIESGFTPIKRWGYPEDIANAVSVLCSGKLGFSTGEVINVDGGFHIRRL
ncbi:MAG: 3-ketoacyl-ACP reductase [Ruminiclostridium sp.]|nr:3-ketoacyl-ACP reductase [Ruminiclostridium sp.]